MKMNQCLGQRQLVEPLAVSVLSYPEGKGEKPLTQEKELDFGEEQPFSPHRSRFPTKR